MGVHGAQCSPISILASNAVGRRGPRFGGMAPSVLFLHRDSLVYGHPAKCAFSRLGMVTLATFAVTTWIWWQAPLWNDAPRRLAWPRHGDVGNAAHFFASRCFSGFF